jgi:hypothetical protein
MNTRVWIVAKLRSAQRRRMSLNSPTLDDGRSRTLGCDDLRGRVNKIPQHLPANGGIRIKQPFQYAHKAAFSVRGLSHRIGAAKRQVPVGPGNSFNAPRVPNR